MTPTELALVVVLLALVVVAATTVLYLMHTPSGTALAAVMLGGVARITDRPGTHRAAAEPLVAGTPAVGRAPVQPTGAWPVRATRLRISGPVQALMRGGCGTCGQPSVYGECTNAMICSALRLRPAPPEVVGLRLARLQELAEGRVDLVGRAA